jgi:hypothetical protein
VPAATNDRTRDIQGGSAIRSTEVIHVDNSSVSSTYWWQRIFPAIFVLVSAVAMIGWLIALGWAAIELGEWLFF